MLRLASFGDEPFDGLAGIQFEERVLRRYRVTSARESVRYWSPAFVGAAIAGLSVLAALQLVINRPGTPATSRPIGEAKLERKGENLPLIDLSRIDRLR
ncbi:MAG: hypothetical protein IT203_06410 [Fimbriimonadaceae bacterium]|nr:hypothetical protein [Fimbriimonadaceae bacterium]